MEAQFQKGRCPGCKATGTLLVESDHSIGCDSCEGLWEIEDLLRIIQRRKDYEAPLSRTEKVSRQAEWDNQQHQYEENMSR